MYYMFCFMFFAQTVGAVSLVRQSAADSHTKETTRAFPFPVWGRGTLS